MNRMRAVRPILQGITITRNLPPTQSNREINRAAMDLTSTYRVHHHVLMFSLIK